MLGFLTLALMGCASSTAGTASLTGDKVKEIRKGVTTRRDIEAMFGPAERISMSGGGRHVMSYHFSQSNVRTTPLTFVPLIGEFAGGTEGETEIRTLLVNLDPKDIVEDFQFNDNTTEVKRNGVLGNSSTPVASQSQSP